MENKGPKKENVMAIIAESLKKARNSENKTRDFHPVYGKPYFDDSDGYGEPLKKNNRY
jgi:hypothetical protein